MKNINIIIIFSLLFGFTSVYAQQTTINKDAANKSSNTLTDPKLSPEEQTLILNAGNDNPAKIDESQLVDPKIDPASLPTEEDYGESNANGESIDFKKEVVTPAAQLPVKKAAPGIKSSQPRGKKSGTVINYRNLSGSNDQPKGKTPEKVTNYRNMKGNNSQSLPPATKDPNKLN